MNQQLATQQDYESGLLGAFLCYERTWDLIPRLRATDFSKRQYQQIFVAIETLHKAGQGMDGLIVCEWLKNRFGDAQRLLVTELMFAACAPSVALYYLKQIKSARLTELLVSGEDLIEQGTDPMVLARQIKDLIEEPKEIAPAPRFKYHSISELAREVVEETKHHRSQPGTIKGIPSGISMLDDVLLGFQNGEMIIIAARPTEGKTVLGLTIASNVTRGYGLSVGYVCLEMSNHALVRRYLSAHTRVDTRHMRMGIIEDHEVALLEEETEKTRALKLTLADQSSGVRTVSQIRNWYLGQDEKPRLLIVDHLHIVASEQTGQSTQFQVVSEVSTGLKRLAGELNIPVIVLCQLSRPEKQAYSKGKPVIVKPTLQSLRGSGNIEQDADSVIFIHRPHTQDPDRPIGEAFLLVRKNREGESDKDIEVVYEPGRAFRDQTTSTMERKLYDPNLRVEQIETKVTNDPVVAEVEPTPQVVEVETEEQEQESKREMNVERFEKDGCAFWETKDGARKRVFSAETCKKIVREAGADIEEKMRRYYAWPFEIQKDENGVPVSQDLQDLHEMWAVECMEGIQAAWEEAYSADFTMDDDEEDLSEFGF